MTPELTTRQKIWLAIWLAIPSPVTILLVFAGVAVLWITPESQSSDSISVLTRLVAVGFGATISFIGLSAIYRDSAIKETAMQLESIDNKLDMLLLEIKKKE